MRLHLTEKWWRNEKQLILRILSFVPRLLVTALLGGGAFRQKALLTNTVGLLDTTAAELTDAADRRGNRFDDFQHSTKSSPALTTRNVHACFSKCLDKEQASCCLSLSGVLIRYRSEKKINDMFSEYNLFHLCQDSSVCFQWSNPLKSPKKRLHTLSCWDVRIPYMTLFQRWL